MNSVKLWREKIIIPTYRPGKPDKNPMFLEKRVYQGSSGVVYPHPVIESISDTKEDCEYDAVFLENLYLKIMILPQLGGRVQMALDKTNDFHFIYYNRVVKPALVGLAGPWISGGIEFNWPQHHRPSTFEPVDSQLIENPDGSKTLRLSEIEVMFRTKATTCFTLYPDKAYLQIDARLYNRTPQPQTFLWWANPAMHVNDDYQSIFPPDVNAVFDHGKRDTSSFPIARGTYYKVDYSAGVDISRYKNIPVPTSFMAARSNYDFMGGYDHGKRAGMLHWADHHVSPGKKQWVWGNGDFGKAWDRNLTDEDGPYVELMTGVFTDNQPDFSWLMPCEEKSFTQYFMPYKEIGAVKNATTDAAVNLDLEGQYARIGVYVTAAQKNLTIRLLKAGQVVFETKIDLTPQKAFLTTVPLQGKDLTKAYRIVILNQDGRELVSYQPGHDSFDDIQPARPLLEPQQIATQEELYLAGLHLEQYRHATYRPEDYYQEALRRDPDDARCNNALGLLLYRRGSFTESQACFKRAIARLTWRNPNPYDGEPYYNLGLALRMEGHTDQAYDAFYKSVWNAAWQDAGYLALAQIASSKGNYQQAIDFARRSLVRNDHNQKARHLLGALLRKVGRLDDAAGAINYALAFDGLDFGMLFEQYQLDGVTGQKDNATNSLETFQSRISGNVQNYIEIALDYAAAGLYDESLELLRLSEKLYPEAEQVYPEVFYFSGWIACQKNDTAAAKTYFQKAAAACSDYCFPYRLESILALQTAIRQNPTDARAFYYLGNLWYSKRQHDKAITCWETSVSLDSSYPTVHRNLGLAYYNQRHDAESARKEYETAYTLDTTDARVLFELDQLYKKMLYTPPKRLAFLQSHLDTVGLRDDLYVEYIHLLNLTGNYRQSLDLLKDRIFHPWEGGEGKVTGVYVSGLLEAAKESLRNNLPQDAIADLQKAKVYPPNLGEGKLYGHRENDIDYYMGLAYEKLGQSDKARDAFDHASRGSIEPGGVMFYNDQSADQIFYQGLAFIKLQKCDAGKKCFNTLIDYGRQHLADQVKIDYFAVSLPDFLVFDEDLNRKNETYCRYLMGLGFLGLDRLQKAQVAFKQILQADPSHAGAITGLYQARPSGRLISQVVNVSLAEEVNLNL